MNVFGKLLWQNIIYRGIDIFLLGSWFNPVKVRPYELGQISQFSLATSEFKVSNNNNVPKYKLNRKRNITES